MSLLTSRQTLDETFTGFWRECFDDNLSNIHYLLVVITYNQKDSKAYLLFSEKYMDPDQIDIKTKTYLKLFIIKLDNSSLSLFFPHGHFNKLITLHFCSCALDIYHCK